MLTSDPRISAESSLPKTWARQYFTVWTGQAFSLVGSALVQFSLVWWLTQKTGSATVLTTSSLVALLPQIVLGPFIGTMVDRWNRRLIMILADSSIALVTGLLMILFALGKVQLCHVYLTLFLRSLGGAFQSPAMTSSTSLMVPDNFLTRVAGMNNTLQGFISIFSPPLGALLLGLLPMEQVLAVDIFTATMAVIPLFFIPIPQPQPRVSHSGETDGKVSYWYDIKEGFRYVVKWQGLLGILLLAMLLNFMLSPASSLLPLLVKQEFHGGAQQLGWVESTIGMGVILGGITLSAWGGFKHRIVTCFSGIIGIGVGISVVGLTPGNMFWLLLGSNFILGFSQVLANGPLFAIFQSAVSPEMQGRVFSLIGAGAAAMMPLSLLIAGPLSDWMGIRIWYIMGGAVCIVVAVVAFFIPSIMNIEQSRNSSLI